MADNGVPGNDPVQLGGAALGDRPKDRSAHQPVFMVWGLAPAGLLAIGSIGPWATLGALSVSGTSNGRDGIVTLVLAGIAVLVLLFRSWIWGVLIAGVLALATAVYDIVNINNMDNGFLTPSPGWGIILAAVSSLSLCVWPFVVRNASR